MDIDLLFKISNIKSLNGRYISLNDIEPILFSLNTCKSLSIAGKSVSGKPIYTYTIGTGSKRVLIWSQMHGNETTTTKALMDFLQFLNRNNDFGNKLLDTFTICCLPMLNPDGAEVYTRENANNIDLNRDFQIFSQPESNILMKIFNDFKPNFCFNMHDQKSIYGLENDTTPATISFLAPAFNKNKDFNSTRLEACRIINAVYLKLKNDIPNQIGRFDDTYNANCCGDTFQKKNVPTILFEAGHFQNDYEREIVRKYIFFSLIYSFISLTDSNLCKTNIIDDYSNIPKNKVNFYDILIKNVKFIDNNSNKYLSIAIQYNEKLINNKIHFLGEIVNIGLISNCHGHIELDAENELYISNSNIELKINSTANFKIINKIEINNGIVNFIKV